MRTCQAFTSLLVEWGAYRKNRGIHRKSQSYRDPCFEKHPDAQGRVEKDKCPSESNTAKLQAVCPSHFRLLPCHFNSLHKNADFVCSWFVLSDALFGKLYVFPPVTPWETRRELGSCWALDLAGARGRVFSESLSQKPLPSEQSPERYPYIMEGVCISRYVG